jgi:hypothetical protein
MKNGVVAIYLEAMSFLCGGKAASNTPQTVSSGLKRVAIAG